MRISDWSSDVCSSDLPFAVEGGTAHGSANKRIFGYVEVIGQYRLAQRVEHEAGLAIQRPATGGLHQGAQQAYGQRCFEQHWEASCFNTARRQAGQSTFGRVTPYCTRVGQIGRAQRLNSSH